LGIVHREVQNSTRSVWEEALGGVATQAYVPAGELVFRAGEHPRIALIRAGVVRVFVGTTAGRQLTIRYARPGDVIGLAPLLGGSSIWNAQAMANTTLAEVTVEQLRAAAARRPELPWLVAEHVARWASETVRTLAHSSSHPMASRVAHHLREVALPAPDGRTVAHISHQGLADAVGTVREVISRQLRILRADGVIDTEPGAVIVVNQQRLQGIAEGQSPGVT
jgi:CRP/FNR family cyclic AMP-dependent transcriptional regulator